MSEGRETPRDGDGARSAVQSFYGRWAAGYDLLATRTPGVSRLRARAVDALDLSAGDTVVDVGCGTGATLPSLRERVGPEGTVVGVDLTRPLVGRARRRTEEWPNVHVACGDATALPIEGPVDAVVATFVSGMLSDPAAAVESWADHLVEGGRLCLLDGASSPHLWAYPAGLAFRAFVYLGAPPESRRGEEHVTRVLDRRVAGAHRAVTARSTDAREERRALGFVRLTFGRVE